MSNPAKQRGTAFETAVKRYHEAGGKKGRSYQVQRLPLNGGVDLGDVELRGKYIFTLQCKAQKAFNLAQWVRDAEAQSLAAGTDWGVAVVKAPGQNISRAYVVMSLETFRDLAEEIL